MLMTQKPISAIVTNQKDNTYNSRSRSRSNTLDKNPDSAIELRNPASLARSSGDRDYHTYTYTMNGILGSAPPGTLYVRALYDYEADDRTSLSFHEGDVIQVITQLESGWWDGVINGVRGWFPSNYCQIITNPDEIPDQMQDNGGDIRDDESEGQAAYDVDFEDPLDESEDELSGLPLGITKTSRKSGADFWIPQATPDGRLFYYNTMTGESSMELPLESPTSFNENGPLDPMTVKMPDKKTRVPPEMFARGIQDEEDDSGATSASEPDNDYMNSSVSSLVCLAT